MAVLHFFLQNSPLIYILFSMIIAWYISIQCTIYCSTLLNILIKERKSLVHRYYVGSFGRNSVLAAELQCTQRWMHCFFFHFVRSSFVRPLILLVFFNKKNIQFVLKIIVHFPSILFVILLKDRSVKSFVQLRLLVQYKLLFFKFV